MMGLKIDEADAEALVRTLLSGLKEQILSDLLTEIRQQIVQMNLIGEGQLFKDIEPRFQEGVIYINAPHAGWVEYGTPGMVNAPAGRTPGRKGPPPRDKIERWAGLKIKGATGKQATKKQKSIMADRVVWSIYMNGTKPHPFLRNAIDRIEQKYRNYGVVIQVVG